MSELPLKLDKGFLYMQVRADWCLIDTGSFSSFSEHRSFWSTRTKRSQ
jgi:hypothetical protein